MRDKPTHSKINIMKQFQELKNKRPELAEMLESMSKEELLNHYAIEVAEKDDLEDEKDYYQKDPEGIVNAAKKWLKNNGKTNHYFYISTEKIELIQKETVDRSWI